MGERDQVPGFLRRHFTLQNVALVALLLFQAGGWWRDAQAGGIVTAGRVDRVELELEAAEIRSDAIYARKDVVEAELRAIREQLDAALALLRQGR